MSRKVPTKGGPLSGKRKNQGGVIVATQYEKKKNSGDVGEELRVTGDQTKMKGWH